VEADLRRAKGGKIPASAAGHERALASVVHREKGAGEIFPWDVVEGGIRKDALRARYEAFRRS
jgi:hypothetical protein